MIFLAANVTSTTPGPWVSTERPLTIEITINAPKIEIYTVGSTVRFNCSATSLIGRGPVRVQWTRDGARLPEHALDDGNGLLVITDLRASDSGRYICEASDGWTIESKDIVVTVGRKLNLFYFHLILWYFFLTHTKIFFQMP